MDNKKEPEKHEEGLVSLKVEDKKEESKMEKKLVKNDDSISVGFLGRPMFWQILSVLLLIGLIASLFSMSSDSGVKSISGDEAKAKVQEYVDLVLQDRASFASLGEIGEDRGLYTLDVTVQGQTIKSYLTKDGKLFFPNAVELDEIANLPVINAPPQVQVPPAVDDGPQIKDGSADQVGDSGAPVDEMNLVGAENNSEE